MTPRKVRLTRRVSERMNKLTTHPDLFGFVRRQKFNKAVLSALLAVGVLFAFTAYSQSTRIPIQHFIFIIQENHSFDNYFGTFPYANGIPLGTALPDYPGGPLVNKPFSVERSKFTISLTRGSRASLLTITGQWTASSGQSGLAPNFFAFLSSNRFSARGSPQTH